MNTIAHGAFFIALAIICMLLTLALPKLDTSSFKMENDKVIRSAYN